MTAWPHVIEFLTTDDVVADGNCASGVFRWQRENAAGLTVVRASDWPDCPEIVRAARLSGYGDGSGNGYGYGDGSGNGDGNGNGYGDGYGYGYGYGNGGDSEAA